MNQPAGILSLVRGILFASALTLASSAAVMPAAAQSESQRTNPYLENLTADNTVFIAVDFLTGFQPAIRTMDRDLYQNNLTGLAKTVRIFNLPTIVLGDEGPPRGTFMPQIAQYFGSGTRVARGTPSAWREKAFVDAIARTGRRKLVFAGISIDNCTMLTAIDAMRAGYRVYVVSDVSGAESELIQSTAMQRLVQAGATPLTWVSFGSELLVSKGGWATPEGKALSDVYTRHTLYFQQ